MKLLILTHSEGRDFLHRSPSHPSLALCSQQPDYPQHPGPPLPHAPPPYTYRPGSGVELRLLVNGTCGLFTFPTPRTLKLISRVETCIFLLVTAALCLASALTSFLILSPAPICLAREGTLLILIQKISILDARTECNCFLSWSVGSSFWK